MCTGPVVLQLTKAELKGEKNKTFKQNLQEITKNITGKIETKLNWLYKVFETWHGIAWYNMVL